MFVHCSFEYCASLLLWSDPERFESQIFVFAASRPSITSEMYDSPNVGNLVARLQCGCMSGVVTSTLDHLRRRN